MVKTFTLLFSLKNGLLKTIFLFILSTPLFGTLLLAQNDIVKFEHISIEQGLSQTTVYCIFQDSKGFMWFGTRDGLHKYDGYNFIVYKHRPNNPNSLSNSGIRAITEDHFGNIWIGTERGLNKFNRKKEKFTRYTHNPKNINSLSNNRIRTMLTDQKGNIWIGTMGGGLNRIELSSNTISKKPINDVEIKFSHFKYDVNNPKSISNNNIYSLLEDRAGILWIGTIGGGLNKKDTANNSFIHYRHDPNNPSSLSNDNVNTIWEDKFGNFWIGTRGGGLDKLILPLNEESEMPNFIHYRHNNKNNNSLAYDNVNTICEDQSGTIWFGTYGGGLRRLKLEGGHKNSASIFLNYSHDSKNNKSVSHNVIRSVYTDRSGILWVGTSEGGLNKYDERKWKFKNHEYLFENQKHLDTRSVSSIFEDKEGGLWVGNYGSGLNYLSKKNGEKKYSLRNHFGHESNNPKSINSNVILSIYEDLSGIIWIGTIDGGLNKFDRRKNTFTYYEHNPDNPFSISNNRVMSIYEDPDEADSIIWIGTYGGLNKFERRKNKFTHYQHHPGDSASLSNNNINVIYEDRNNHLWVGTNGGGLNKFDRTTEKFIRYSTGGLNGLNHNEINVIHESNNQSGLLWIGTNGGLSAFDTEDETMINYDIIHGLPNDVIVGLLEDENGKLWLSTYNGISMFDPKSETFKNYDVHDGLQNNEFNFGAFHKNKDGEMFFGGIKGLNSFYPAIIKAIKDNQHVPDVVITGFDIFNKHVKIKGETIEKGDKFILENHISETKDIVLNYYENVFSFEFAALHYSYPEENKYAYKMVGFDQDWIYSGTRRYATYTNLGPGKYIFTVKGANNDGVWNKINTTLNITILPPWWMTWWAKCFYLILGLGVLWMIRQADIKKHLLKIAVQERELEQERLAQRFVPYKSIQLLGRNSIPEITLDDFVQRNVSVFFSDIRDYTTLSEMMTPKENYHFVKAYMGRMSPVIQQHQGFVNQYLGDGIMAIFPESPQYALQAAIDMQRLIRDYNKGRIINNRQPIKVGMGLHTGPLIMGIIGDEKRMDVASISDTVNSASRIESLTKYFGANILLSEDSYNLIPDKDPFHFRQLGKVLVKGKKTPIGIYECFDGDGAVVFEKKLQTLPLFKDGLNYYMDNDFPKAAFAFQELLKIHPKDFTAQLFLNKANKFMATSVPAEWTGVEMLEDK